MKINIVGLHKATVLLALYNNAQFEGSGFASEPMMKILARMAPPASPEVAMQEIEARGERNNYYFDYVDLGGGPRSLKVDLSGFEFDSTLYDRDHGDGAAKAAISVLRQAAISEYGKGSNRNSFTELLARVNVALLEQEEQDRAASVAEQKQDSPRPTI